MYTSDVLKFMYPIMTDNDFELKKEVDGTYTIIRWNTVKCGAPPTQAQINAASPAAQSALIMSAIRAERDRRLVATDYMAMPDYPATKKPVGLSVYRQSLRNFPATIDASTLAWPLNASTINWPVL